MHLNISSAKWRPFSPEGGELNCNCGDIPQNQFSPVRSLASMCHIGMTISPQKLGRCDEKNVVRLYPKLFKLLPTLVPCYKSNDRYPRSMTTPNSHPQLKLPFDDPQVNSLWPSNARWRQKSESTLAQVMALLPDGTKPLPETMLTDHQWSPVTFILGQFHNRWINHQ